MGEAEEKIKVVVRVRKLITRERDQLKAFTVQDATDIVQKKTTKSWTFDRVYSQLDNNRTVYVDTASEMIESVVSGFNTTIFAYGQTSSGKTHTMHGCPEEIGVIGMAIEQLFYAVEETPDRRFLMQVSYMEIYNETVIDLLSDPKSRGAGGLKVRETEDGEVYVEGLEQKTVTSPEEIDRYMKLGEKSRHVGQTKMNDKSSRSHTIFRITLESTNRMTDDETLEDADEEGRQVTVSQLNLVDLAGSEKANQTGNAGARLKEGCNINQSLSVLGQVIQKLSGGDKRAHINYRDSKLTRILQNSIGGNAKTAIICTVTPAAMSEDQTISTLRFASQAKTIQNHAKVNEVLDDKAQINRMKKEMAKLLAELEQQKKVGNTEMVQEMREQLERERKEKEEHIRKNRELQEKVITSSQPAPPRKSMMIKKKERRETWCGPAMKRNMRMSFAPHKFTMPLLPLDLNLPASVEQFPPVDEDVNLANLSLASADFNLSHSSLVQQLNTQEARRLSEMFEEEEEDIESTLPPFNDSVFEKKKVKFVSSPQFLTPKKRINNFVDLNGTDNGTPKAIIRDKYKRVSMALTTREEELEKEREARIYLEREHQELQEFTRLESEGLDDERRMSVHSNSPETMERLKWYEKSFKDSESLNLELSKQIHESKEETSKLLLVVGNLEDALIEVNKKDAENSARVAELEPLVEEVNQLREKTDDLEKQKMDFEMQLEMAVAKAENTVIDLRGYLDSAYEEIATLEKGNKADVRARHDNLREMKKRIEDLEMEVKRKDKLVETAEVIKDEYESLKDGMEVVTAEITKLSEEKVLLEDQVKTLQTELGKENIQDDARISGLEAENAKLEKLLQNKHVEMSNLELSNASLLETVDELSRKNEEIDQKNSEVLVVSAELERFNVELKEEIIQLKSEVKAVTESKDKLELENQELKSELEEAVLSKNNMEELINKSQNTEEVEELKKEMKQMEEAKAELEAKLKSDDLNLVLNKLSTTLNCIEDSFISQDDCANKTCPTDSPNHGNATFANVTVGGGIPLEVVEEIKTQLIYLQERLINCSPEMLELKVKEVEELRLENEKLVKQIEDADVLKQNSHELKENIAEVKAKHKTEIAIVTTKMREDMNFNLAALEEKLRDEHEGRKAEIIKDVTREYEEKFINMKTQLIESQQNIAELNQKLEESRVKTTENPSSQKNTSLGVWPSKKVDNLDSSETHYTTCEMSFDETICGNSSMSLTMVTNPYVGVASEESFEVQMLKGELEQVRKVLQQKEQEIEDALADLESAIIEKETSQEQVTQYELKLSEVSRSVDTKAEEYQVVEDMSNEIETLKRENEKLLTDRCQLTEEIQRLESSNANHQQKLNSSGESVANVMAEKEQAIADLSIARNVIEQKQNIIENTLADLENAIIEKETSQELLSQYEEKLSDMSKIIETHKLAETNMEASHAKLVKERCQLTEEIQRLESSNANYQQKLNCTEESVANVMAEKEQAIADLSNARNVIDQKQNIVENTLADLESAIIEKETCQELASQYEDKLSEMSKMVETNMDASNAKLVIEVEVLKTENEKLSTANNEVLMAIERLELTNGNLEKKFNDAGESVAKLMVEKENALADLKLTRSVIEENDDLVKNAMANRDEVLSERDNLQEVLLLQEKLSEVYSSFEGLKLSEKELESLNEKSQLEIECLKNEKEKLLEENSNLAVEMKRLVESNGNFELKFNDAGQNVADLTAEKEKAIKDLESAVMQRESLKQQVREYVESFEASKELLHAKSSEVEILKKENEKLVAENNGVADEVETIQVYAGKLENDLKKARDSIDALVAEKDNEVADFESAVIEKEMLQEQLTAMCSTVEDIKLAKEEIEASHSKLSKEIRCLIKEKENSSTESAKVKQEMKELELRYGNLELKASETVKSLDSVAAEKESVKVEYLEIENQRDALIDECDKLETRLLVANEKLKRYEVENEQVTELKEQILNLNLQAEEFCNVRQENKDLKDKLASLNSKIMGNETKYKMEIKELEGRVERLKDDLIDVEKQRDIVDAACDQLESELEETKCKSAANVTSEAASDLNSLQSTMMAGQHTLLNNVSMDCTYIPAPSVQLLRDLEFQKEELVKEVNDLKRQLASTPTEEKYKNLKTQLITQKEYSDKVFKENKQLQQYVAKVQNDASADRRVLLEQQLAEVKEELGRKNIEYASLKVDVEKGELEYQKKCEILQSDLDYEKANNSRLTKEIRRNQSSAMDTTVINSKAKSKASEMTTSTSTSTVAAGSPVWSSGSGAIKEIRLHNAEMKVKSLEKENEKLKEHEEFYINKAREWKGRALKYEKVLEQNSIEIPSKERRRATDSNTVVDVNSSEKSSENVTNTPDVPPVDSATAKVYQAAGFSPRTSANPLKDLQNLRAEEAVNSSPPVTPTEDIKLVLSRRSEVRKTEDDFRLPEAPRPKRDECKQQ